MEENAMTATKNKYNFSQAIVGRGQEQFANRGDSNQKKESDRFFYWLMEQMVKEAEVLSWERHSYELSLTTRMYYGNRIEVYHRGPYHTDKYVPNEKLTKAQFFKVMQEVTEIINTLPNFTASYIQKKEFENACLYVTMVIPHEKPKTNFVAKV